jgi:hypothetical protein
VKHFEKYNKNKLGTCRAWAEKMGSLPQYEKLRVTAKQIKNFIATQITTFHRAMEKKDSTGFGDLDDATAEDQLIEICKFWYSLIPLYIANCRKDLLPVLRDSALVNPGAELNSDGLDELSDNASISGSNSDPDTNESGMESSGKDEEDSGQYVRSKHGSSNTTSVNDYDSDIEDTSSKKNPKAKSTKKSAKYTPISGRKSIVRDQYELKRIAMDIKREKVAIKKQKLEAEQQSKEYEFELAREKLKLERMRLELQRDKTQSSHNNHGFTDITSPNSWMNNYDGSIGGTDEHEFSGPTV